MDVLGGLKKFGKDCFALFSGRYLLWHGLAIGVTYLLVVSGFDWWVVRSAQGSFLRVLASPAGFIGFMLPWAAPLIAFAFGIMRRNKKLIMTGWLIAQAEIMAVLLSFFYKAFTGRPGPAGFHGTSFVDTSHVFRFGFLEGGVFWGWPSSHTLVAVAGAVTLLLLYPQNKFVRCCSITYAAYIALSVSVSFHWFSDCVAGVIFGVIVAMVVVQSSRQAK